MKIKSLTDEQVAKFPEYVDKWLKIGLSTEPLDFDNAKKCIIEEYKVAGLKEPKYFYHFRSPYEAAIAATILKKSDQVWDQVRGQVSDQVSDQVWGQVGDQVRDQVWGQVGDQVRDQVWGQVRGQLQGSQDAPWLSFYDFMINELHISGCDMLNPLMNLAKCCGWWAPYENAVIMQDRPELIKFDDEKRLHCENGPAIKYRDGFSVYVWHGQRIHSEWIEKGVDAKTALTWGNIEQRRAACEIVGWDNILNELNAITIEKDDDPLIGELVEVDIPDIGKEKFLRVTCGTGRKFALPVPPEMTTALQANAWTYGFDDANDFIKPEIRT